MDKEEEAWRELETKLDPETIDCKPNVTPAMRKWFRETFDYVADDKTICLAWRRKDNT